MKKTDKKIVKQIIHLYTKQKFPATKIASELGLGTTTVYRHLKHHGINPSQCGRIGKGNKNYKFTDKTEKQILQEYKSGKGVSFLSNKYNCALVTISKIVKRQGGTVRSRGGPRLILTASQQEKIITLYNQGLSQESVAVETGISLNRTKRCLEQHGIVSHTKREGRGSWRGRKVINSGYIMIRPPYNHPFYEMVNSHGYVMEHRLIMAESLNRPLHTWETVHHIDGIPGNNRLDNLQLRVGNHSKHISYRCSSCGSVAIEPCEIN